MSQRFKKHETRKNKTFRLKIHLSTYLIHIGWRPRQPMFSRNLKILLCSCGLLHRMRSTNVFREWNNSTKVLTIKNLFSNLRNKTIFSVEGGEKQNFENFTSCCLCCSFTFHNSRERQKHVEKFRLILKSLNTKRDNLIRLTSSFVDV